MKTNKYETIELMDYLNDKITKLTQEKEFALVKDKIRDKVFLILNMTLELKHILLFDEGDDESIEKVLDLINEFYIKIYDSRDRPRRAIFKKVEK